MDELPAIASSNYASSTIDMAQLVARHPAGLGYVHQAFQNHFNPPHGVVSPTIAKPQEKVMAQTTRRLVQVFIADPDENVPLAESLLYSGEQKLTDLTDQELFFEIDVRTILAQHNEKRVKLVNKAVKERMENLEPARIRDLKMTVVNIATF